MGILKRVAQSPAGCYKSKGQFLTVALLLWKYSSSLIQEKADPVIPPNAVSVGILWRSAFCKLVVNDHVAVPGGINADRLYSFEPAVDMASIPMLIVNLRPGRQGILFTGPTLMGIIQLCLLSSPASI
jgi:hypothetical protein